MDLIKYFGVIGIVLMCVEYAQPLKWVKTYFRIDQDATLKDSEWQRKILQGMVNCCLCLGFWIGLTFYLNLYWAVIIAFSSELAYMIFNKIKLILFK